MDTQERHAFLRDQATKHGLTLQQAKRNATDAAEWAAASLDRAIQYAQKAVDEITKLKSGPPQQGYTDDQWKQYIESNDQLAKQYLAYARALKR